MKMPFTAHPGLRGRIAKLRAARLNDELQRRFDALGDDCSGAEVLSAVRSAAAAHGVSETFADFGPFEWKVIQDFLATLPSLDRQVFVLYKRPLSIDAVALELQLDREAVIRSLAQTYAGLSSALPRSGQTLD